MEDLDDQIVECADGADACRLYEVHHPDWVLMDLSMQPMDGLTAIRQILARSPEARIVVITRHDDSATREQVRGAGAVAFISKNDLLPLRLLLGGT